MRIREVDRSYREYEERSRQIRATQVRIAKALLDFVCKAIAKDWDSLEDCGDTHSVGSRGVE